jgi:hypothetical protein
LGDADPGWDLCSPVAPSREAIRFDAAWRTSTVVSLATGISQDGNFDALPILADALQDAGCDNHILLNHCRHGVRHTEDCWALQLMLALKPPVTKQPVAPPASPSILEEAAQVVDELGDRGRGWVIAPVMALSFATVLFLDSTSPLFHSLLGRDENYIVFFCLFMTLTLAPSLFALFLVGYVKAMWNRRRRARG